MLRFVVCAALIALAAPGRAAELPAPEIEAIAREAFIWGYPVVENYNVLHSLALDPSLPSFKAPLNAIGHARLLATPQDRAIVAPNVDTLYSYAWLDLRSEPVILTIPPLEKNRYVSLQLIDAYTYILGYVSPRTNGYGGGEFLVVGPGWDGPVPNRIKAVFRSPTSLVLAHYRTQFMGSGDLPRVHEVQDQFRVEPLSIFLGASPPQAAPHVKAVPPVDLRKDPLSMQFFRILNWMLEYMPDLPEERAMRQRFARIGVGPSLSFDPSGGEWAAIAKGMEQGLADMEARASTMTSSAELFGSRAQLGQDYLSRAVAAMIGIYGNAPEEFLGVGYPADAQGRPFDGRNNYTITFKPGGLPDVGAFWSITAYDIDRLLYDNSLSRYAITSAMLPGFQRNADGGFTIYVQHHSPGKDRDANWLPVPEGPFILTFRTYMPGLSVRQGDWKASPVFMN